MADYAQPIYYKVLSFEITGRSVVDIWSRGIIVTVLLFFTSLALLAGIILYEAKGDLSEVDAIRTPVGDLFNLSGAHFTWSIQVDSDYLPYDARQLSNSDYRARYEEWGQSQVSFINRPNGAPDLLSGVDFFEESFFTENSEVRPDTFRIQQGSVRELSSPYVDPRDATFMMGILIAEFTSDFYQELTWAKLPSDFDAADVTRFTTLSNGADQFLFQVGTISANNGPVYFSNNVSMSAREINNIPEHSVISLFILGFSLLYSMWRKQGDGM